jgi:ribosome-binding protein aMBF1 (putative translation factor)
MKKDPKKLDPAPHRIIREMTPAERTRWRRALAEEETPENMAAARRAKRTSEAGRTLLGDVVRLLREERERQGLSVATVADRCDMERSTISRLETAATPNPTVATLCALAEAIGKKIAVRLEDA